MPPQSEWTQTRSARGFSLVEVLVAIALLGGALTALGQLIAMAARANVSARAATVSVVLATQKMEQLRADGETAAVGGSLQNDVNGYADYFDGTARALASGNSPATGVSFLRRWSVEPLSVDPLRSRVLRVRVMRLFGAAASAPQWPGVGLDEARLLTVVTARDR